IAVAGAGLEWIRTPDAGAAPQDHGTGLVEEAVVEGEEPMSTFPTRALGVAATRLSGLRPPNAGGPAAQAAAAALVVRRTRPSCSVRSVETLTGQARTRSPDAFVESCRTRPARTVGGNGASLAGVRAAAAEEHRNAARDPQYRLRGVGRAEERDRHLVG